MELPLGCLSQGAEHIFETRAQHSCFRCVLVSAVAPRGDAQSCVLINIVISCNLIYYNIIGFNMHLGRLSVAAMFYYWSRSSYCCGLKVVGGVLALVVAVV